MARSRRENGDGSCRKLENGKWECIVQSSYVNPKTGGYDCMFWKSKT